MNEDPGWQFSWRTLRFLIPHVGVRTVRNESDGLSATRSLFLSFALALLLFGVVIAFVADKNATGGLGWLVAIAVWGVASFVVTAFVERPLDCTGALALGTSYRNRFFLRIAVSESVALLGFVATFAGGPWWSYYAALPFTIIGYSRAAPSVRNIVADQERLNATGCTESIVAALRTPPARPA